MSDVKDEQSQEPSYPSEFFTVESKGDGGYAGLGINQQQQQQPIVQPSEANNNKHDSGNPDPVQQGDQKHLSPAQLRAHAIAQQDAENWQNAYSDFVIRLAGACGEDSVNAILNRDINDIQNEIKNQHDVDSLNKLVTVVKPTYAQATCVTLEYAQKCCNNRVKLPLSVQITKHLNSFVQLAAIQYRISTLTTHPSIYEQPSVTALREKMLKQLSNYYCALR